jgi:hypothetical protein
MARYLSGELVGLDASPVHQPGNPAEELRHRGEPSGGLAGTAPRRPPKHVLILNLKLL